MTIIGKNSECSIIDMLHEIKYDCIIKKEKIKNFEKNISLNTYIDKKTLFDIQLLNY